MAIVKMKKLRVIATASQKEELMQKLLMLGCVELREQDTLLEDPKVAAMVSRELGDVSSARNERQIFAEAIRILDRYAPVKTPLLSPKPGVSGEILMDDTHTMELILAAKSLAEQEERMHILDSEIAKLELTAESFRPWEHCQAPLDYTGTRHVSAQFGTLPARTDMDALSAALMETTDAAELVEISADENARYVISFCLKEEESAVQDRLRSFGFAPPAFGSAEGLASECIAKAKKRMEKLRTEHIEVEAKIAEAGKYRDDFRIGYDRADTKAGREEEECKLLSTKHALIMDAWAEAEREGEITELLERMECAYEFADPVKEEYPEVPVKLRNNSLSEGLNMVTNMYSLPQYGSVDPNPLMAPFFILFYGIMMADMGYGLVMVLAGLLIMLKKKPKEGFIRYFGELMIEGGIATFVMGIFTGGLFGDAPKWIVKILNPDTTWQGLPALIDPLNDTVKVLIGAIIVGFIHLNYGMAISFVMKKREGKLLDAVCSEGSMWVLFLGLGAFALGLGGKVGIYIGLAAYVLGKMIPAEGIAGRLLALFSGIYSDATGWFGDLLSYARLMALMLAGSVIAQVFNTLGAMPGNLIVFLIVSLLGNTLNFGLNMLGCYVHDLRLQCLEFFNKFYVAGGKPFRPLRMRSRYFDIIQ